MASIADDFNRADSTNLGANWTEDSGSWIIQDNTLRQETAAAQQKCRWVGSALASDDYDVEVDGQSPNAATGVGAFGRGAASATLTYYTAQGFGGDAVYILEVTAGTEVTLASGGAFPATTTTNVRLNCNGTTLTAFMNDSQVAQATDGTLTTGSVGVSCYASINAANAFADNFAAADLAAGGDPELGLITGKLIRGGMLLKGALVR